MTKPKVFRNLIAIQAAENGTVPAEIELLQTGEWNTPWHGHFEITAEDLGEYMQHAKDGLRKGLPIDLEHNTIGGAVGWLGEGKGFDFEIRDNDQGGQSLWASVAWTQKGEQLIKDREFRFFSPEFADEDYEDPEQAGVFYDNVLIGGGLTNRPLFKNLTPVTANDGTKSGTKSLTGNHKQNILYLSEELQNMNLQDLLAKDSKDLTAEEKAFIVEHKSELTDEQVTSLTEAGVLEAEKDPEVDPEKDPEVDPEKDPEADPQADPEADPEADPTPEPESKEAKEAKAAAEKAGLKVVSASDLKKLQEDAKAGRQAHDTLSRKASEEHVDSKLFNEKAGLKMPVAVKASAAEFYHSLDEKQRKQFNEIIDKLPTLKMFDTKGQSGGVAEGSAAAEVMKQANEKVAEAKKAGDKLTLGQAKTQVLASDKDLKARYDDERKEL